MKTIKLSIAGFVQGVSFRYFVKYYAVKLGIKGYVRNLPNGVVEAVAQGEQKQLDELVKECRSGPSFSNVDSVKVEELDSKERFPDFQITR